MGIVYQVLFFLLKGNHIKQKTFFVSYFFVVFLAIACDDSQNYTDISKLPIYDQLIDSHNLRKQLEQITPLASYSNISITNSSNVVVGNVIKVKGILNINVYKDKDKNNNRENQNENIDPTYKNRSSSSQTTEESKCVFL